MLNGVLCSYLVAKNIAKLAKLILTWSKFGNDCHSKPFEFCGDFYEVLCKWNLCGPANDTEMPVN